MGLKGRCNGNLSFFFSGWVSVVSHRERVKRCLKKVAFDGVPSAEVAYSTRHHVVVDAGWKFFLFFPLGTILP